MLKRLRVHLTGNLIAYVALFVALGGSSYAAATIGTGAIKNNSVRGSDIRNNTIRARDTNRGLGLQCPGGTLLHQGACIERALRPAALSWTSGRNVCIANGRRLPTRAELELFRLRGGITLAPGGEWTGDFLPGTGQNRQTINEAAALGAVPRTALRAYRCVSLARR